MKEPKISLCLAYPNTNNPDAHILFRIADYYTDDQKLYPVTYFEEDFSENPKRIGASPKDIYPGMTTLREWNYDLEDHSKIRSYNYGGKIYEIIFPKELSQIDYSDTKEIRRVLCEGFSMDENISDNILISIGKSGSHNAFLLCKKRDLKKNRDGLFSIASDTRDMLHCIHCLDEYDIVDDEIINSSNCNIFLPSGHRAPVRYFYNSTTLPERIGIFHPISFSKYIPSLVSSYIKKQKNTLQFSLNDIRKITDVIDVILNDQESISDFFRTTGFTKEQLETLLPKYRQIIVECLSGDAEIDTIMQKCLAQDPDMQERFVELVRTSWLEEKSEEKQQILDELNELEEKYAKYEADILAQIEKKNEIIEEISSFEKTLISKKEEYAKIQSDIETELVNFSDNIVHNTAIRAVAFSASTNTPSGTIDLITLEPNVTDSKEQLTDYDDFQEALADNLIACGYDDVTADQMAQLISFCIAERLPILLPSNEDEIAKCVAATFDACVSVLNIGSGMHVSDYVSAIKNSNNKILLVNGAFAGFSTEHFNSIRYNFTNNGIITFFSLDGAEIGMIPKSVYEKSMILESCYGFTCSSLKELNRYDVHYLVFMKAYNESDFLKQRKKLNPFVEAGIISTVAASIYSKFMVDIECDIHKDWLLLLQLCAQAKASYKIDVLSEWFSNNNVDIDRLINYM